METLGMIALVVVVFGGYVSWARYQRRLEKEPASADNPYGQGHDDHSHDRTN